MRTRPATKRTLRCLPMSPSPPVSLPTTPSFQPRSFARSRVGAPKPSPMALASFASEKIELFLEQNWPFGDPLPVIYYAPSTIEPGSLASVHAKCVVVDEATTLITSANFTARGQTRNVEVGVLLHDPHLAHGLLANWKSAAAAGQFVRYVRYVTYGNR